MLYIRATVRLKLFTARVPTKSLVQPHRRFVARCRMPNLTARCTSPGGPADRPPPSPAKRPKVGAGSPGDGRPVPRAATCARGCGGTRGRGGRGGGGAGAGPPDPNRPPASARAGAFPRAEATAPRGRLLPHGAGSWVSFPKESCNGGERPGEPRPGPAGGIAPLSPPRPAGEGRGAAP